MSDDTRPDDHRDWTEEDWADWAREEEERLDKFCAEVYVALCYAAQLGGTWRFDADSGLDQIAFTASDEEGQLAFRRLWAGEGDHSSPFYGSEVRGIRYDTQTCLKRIFAKGEADLIVEDGWPAIRVPDYARIIAEGIGKDETEDYARWWGRHERLGELRSMPYQEYLVSDEWQRRRQTKLEQAGNRCQLCNAEPEHGNPLHVHHRTYARRGNELAADLTVLCKECHEAFHQRTSVRSEQRS